MQEETRSMRIPHGFLRRKFMAPALSTGYVREERLTLKISDVDAWRVCLMSAAAGYGKTELLAQWFHDASKEPEWHPIWISLDAQDKDPNRFLDSLAVAFQWLSGSFLDFVEAEDQPVESRLVDFINLVDETCSADDVYIVFLDDYDIASSTTFDEALIYLNRFAPENLRFVICGGFISSDLGDLLLDSSVMEFNTDDIAFDDERLRLFAENLMPDLSDEEFEGIFQSSRGWPVAFKFYSLARRRVGADGDPSKLLSGYFSRFFNKNVFDGLDSNACEFLIETSLLEQLYPDLCEAVSGNPRAKNILQDLSARNAFIKYDSKSGCYVHHPYFRRFLLEKLLSLQQSQIASLSHKAETWFTEHGYSEDAICKYLCLACDPYFLEASVKGATGLMAPESHETLVECLLETPTVAFVEKPYFIWSSVWAAISAGRVELARSCIARAMANDTDLEGVENYQYAEAICLALEGESDKSLEVVRAILSDQSTSLSRELHCLLMHMEGEDLERLGKLKEARDTYQRSLSLAERVASPFYRLFDMYLLAQHHFALGQFDSALSYALRILREGQEDSSVYGEACALIASVHMTRHELDEAQEYIRRALRRVSAESNLDMYVDTQVTHARLLQSMGNAIAALEVVDNAIEAVRGKYVARNLSIEAYSAKVSIATYLHDLPSAVSCEYALDLFMGNSDLLRAVPCILAKASIERMRGDVVKARELAMSAREKAQQCSSPKMLVEIGVFLACLEYIEGNDDAAMIEIARAVELAMRCEDVNAFVVGDPAIRELLLKLATSRKSSTAIRAFSKRILSAMGSESQANSEIALAEGDVLGYYALTEREREILNYLNAGMSRKEISDLLSVSQNTVKSHLKNIYSKLGVHSRAEAYRATPDQAQEEGASSI